MECNETKLLNDYDYFCEKVFGLPLRSNGWSKEHDSDDDQFIMFPELNANELNEHITINLNFPIYKEL